MKADKVQKHAINDNVTHNCFVFSQQISPAVVSITAAALMVSSAEDCGAAEDICGNLNSIFYCLLKIEE